MKRLSVSPAALSDRPDGIESQNIDRKAGLIPGRDEESRRYIFYMFYIRA